VAQASQTEARITVAHAGRVIGISTATAYRWAKSGSLGKLQGTRPIYVTLAAIEAACGSIDPRRIQSTRRNTAAPGRPKKKQAGHG
jgi:hypothetical protein